MREKTEKQKRKAVWHWMAEHFLDTETRHEVPLTALSCIKAGLTPEEARKIWQYEVTPALALNLWSVAGEWMGWDPEWLESRIEECRTGIFCSPGVFGYLLYRLSVHFCHGFWVSIERCMQTLADHQTFEEQEQTAHDLKWLAEYYFDFGPFGEDKIDDKRHQQLRDLYPGLFLKIFGPLICKEDRKPGHKRVQVFLENQEQDNEQMG